MPANLPFVSVIVPVRNDASRLELCIEALQRQTYPAEHLEIIIVDNGSSQPVRLPHAGRIALRVIRDEGTSSYGARNRGIFVAKGDVLAFTDSDCIPKPEWLAKGVAYLTKLGPETVVGGEIEVFPQDEQAPTPTELYEMACAFPQDLVIAKQGFAVTANLLVWRTVIVRIGPFNEKLRSGGDTEWGRRAVSRGTRLVFGGGATIRHPARRQLADLLRKALRTTGGAHDQGLNRVTDLPRAIAPPVLTTIRVLKSKRLKGVLQRLKAIVICIVLKYARLCFRLMFIVGVRKRWR